MLVLYNILLQLLPFITGKRLLHLLGPSYYLGYYVKQCYTVLILYTPRMILVS